jgi:RHS repeat-associated protein
MNPDPKRSVSDKNSPIPSRDNTSFFSTARTDADRTKSNLIQIPSVTLPKGGGAIKSIDEKFSVNASNGTASFSIPLPFSPGRNGLTPDLPLNYNSGGGNSLFGIGWNLEIPCIQRKTDKKLPQYVDAEESDTFLFSGAEDLVPELIRDAEGNWKKHVFTVNNVTITRYRPRIEGSFARIEKIEDNNNTYWSVRSKDNTVSVFGKSDRAKLFSPVPGEDHKIFRWCLEYSYNDKGNFIRYSYKTENTENVIPELHERNRQNGLAPFTNVYLKKIEYCNLQPYYEGDDLPDVFLLELVFDFGEHDRDKPAVQEITGWTTRKDPFSDYRAGFEVRTYRLCRRILMFHHFKTELGWDDYLVRSVDIGYDEQPFITYLQNTVQTGYIWNKDGSLKSKKSLPPVEFSYFKPGFSKEVKEIPANYLANAPVGIDNRQYQWTDLYSEGISGLLSEQNGGWYYKENLGNGEFSPARMVSHKPSFQGISEGTMTLQELEGNGKKYLVHTGTSLKGYFELTSSEEWQSFYPFPSFPNINLRDPNLKFLDLNGDGMPDMLLSNEQEFIWYGSKGLEGYDDFNLAAKATDEERGPVILFADTDQRLLVATADMSGDGLADILLISHAGVCYYPNLGYGRFGARVTLEMKGNFDTSTDFNPHFIRLADIDGSGTTDIVYLGKAKVQVWYNQSGNYLSEPFEFFNPFPELDNQSDISFIDLLGNGTSCLVWSTSLPGQRNSPLRFIDIMDGRKPHILFAFKNNLGKEITLEYRSSTQYYLEDKKQGRKWITKLPFPVQCVSKVIVTDKVSQTHFTNEYSYHHGYYDAIEREFRGFAMVEQKDTEEYDHYVKGAMATGSTSTVENDLFQQAVITKSWYHTGSFRDGDDLFHPLRDEYYPVALLKNHPETAPEMIASLKTYELPLSAIPENLTGREAIECLRSLKSLPVRKEVYSDEGDENTRIHPYAVTWFNYGVRILQPRADQKHAVFLTHPEETLVINFERNPLDPRIAHLINIEIDPFGNILESASVVYGRKTSDPGLPTEKDRSKQAQQYVTYALKRFTDPIDISDAFRLPLQFESQTWELNTSAPGKVFFTKEEIKQRFENATVKLYEQEALLNEKRKIEHTRALFLKNDLTGPLPFGMADTLALPYENYVLSFTPTLLSDIYGAKVGESMMRNTARYVRSEGDDNYWIRSGKIYFYPDLTADPFAKFISPPATADVVFARSNFYLPVVFEDNSGNLTKVFYDNHKLFIARAIDSLDNETAVEAFNYRTLSPYLLRDVNDNRTGVRFDEFSLVTHTFVMGKENEYAGDWLDPVSEELSNQDQPTSFLTYEFRFFESSGKLPNRVKTTVRENHYYRDSTSSGGLFNRLAGLFGGNSAAPLIEANISWRESYAYSDGSGHEVLNKVQAEPGEAPQRDAQGNLLKDSFGRIVIADTAPELRWVGNGRTIFNNKGNPVKQYEPFFDSSPEYNNENELVEIGCTSLLYYDALGRLIRTEHPNGSFSKIEFDSWMQKSYDENDTVLNSTWYQQRINGALGQAEQEAAQKSADHDNTPAVIYLDSLARPFLTLTHNKTRRTNESLQEEYFATRSELDIQGNTRLISDARGNPVMTRKYDMLGNVTFQRNIDAGDRWILHDAGINRLVEWDSRYQSLSYQYDALQRPLKRIIISGSSKKTVEQFEYGEGLADAKERNLRGKEYKHFDTAGITVTEMIDFKGNIVRHSLQLIRDYKTEPDWEKSPQLETDIYVSETRYDALNRPVRIQLPDGTAFLPGYNEANLLNFLDAAIKGSASTTSFISNIDYNAKAQRERIQYGNNTTTRYDYDPKTYRMARLITTAENGSRILQDLNYTFDPAGNLTRQLDNAQKTIFYGGQQIEAQSDYRYDALYRLVEAGGREHSGQVVTDVSDNFNDNWSRLSLQPNSPFQLRNYTQKYFYDGSGNILKMQHIAGNPGNWTRTYQYDPTGNHLIKTSVGGQSFGYSYNENGSIVSMPHLPRIDRNFKEEMQHVSLIGGGEAWYVYDSKGQRVRKVIEKQDGTLEERIYLGSLEIYRKRSGNTISLERETLHVMDGKQRIAMIETRTKGNDGTAKQLIRYQYHNHLGSSTLELDEAAHIISFEEYHPFGTSAVMATDASRQIPPGRYRYTGMERDEETGLNYFGARYYVPWLGIWTTTDPDLNKYPAISPYCFVLNNPVKFYDPDGKDVRLSVDQQTHTITYSTTVHFFGTAAEIRQMKPVAQKVEQFFANPTIETQSETEARYAGHPATTARKPEFTDSSGTTWTVKYDVHYEFHDTASVKPAVTVPDLERDPNAYVQNLTATETKLQQDVGFKPGDNVMTIAPANGNTGGVVINVKGSDQNRPVFGEPKSRMVGQISRISPFDASKAQEALAHETGHMLGFDERYRDFSGLVQEHRGFKMDFMTAASGKSSLIMEPIHIEAAARFGIGVANNRTISQQVIRGIQVDSTAGGTIEQFDTQGKVTQAYQNQQTTLTNELIPFFRNKVQAVPVVQTPKKP